VACCAMFRRLFRRSSEAYRGRNVPLRMISS
jgi:hypothetical protein